MSTFPQNMLGVPWVAGGRDVRPIVGGADCLGLVLAGLAQLGIDAPDPREWVAEWWRLGAKIPAIPSGWRQVPTEDARAGDVLVTDGGTHVMLVVPGGFVLGTAKAAGSFLHPSRRVLPLAESAWRWCA